MEEKLMEFFTKFDFIDLIGFAKMMDIEPEIIKKVVVSTAADGKNKNQNWEDLICNTVEEFSKKNRKDKRRFLKLAREIAKNNQETEEN